MPLLPLKTMASGDHLAPTLETLTKQIQQVPRESDEFS
jgi:hypothetical protein